MQIASSLVHVQIVDANDHSPSFPFLFHRMTVSEDTPPATKFSNVSAIDRDSGAFGQLTYMLRGFGTDKFHTNAKTGGLYVTKSLDYETQKSYSLTMEAKDGGGRISTVNVLIELEDVNDNKPVFEQKEYSRTVREGATRFDPQMFVRATDVDGPTQGNGKVTYSISHHNSITNDVFKVKIIFFLIFLQVFVIYFFCCR